MDAKYHINTRFGACRLIALARDEHRGRDVRLYHIPGEFEYVGVHDGIDAWVCPVKADPFSANTPRLLEDIRAGKELPRPEMPHKGRERRVARAQMELPLATPQPAPRARRVAQDPFLAGIAARDNSQPTTRTRRVANPR